ncbi:hypothetical protein [Sagittula salina]|uniref:Uncharacterized protein n=1 Tax=Sagittula salina TaxID=2820268 RepID=A0A940S1C7_9RHOB|nr:hypothetical protein [Sagittula salina]MBP0484008.1 hypothetical protein [Sagittula salina]
MPGLTLTDTTDLPEFQRRMTARAPFVRYRGPRRWEEQHPARPFVWALVWIVVPAFWVGAIYWLTDAVY